MHFLTIYLNCFFFSLPSVFIVIIKGVGTRRITNVPPPNPPTSSPGERVAVLARYLPVLAVAVVVGPGAGSR